MDTSVPILSPITHIYSPSGGVCIDATGLPTAFRVLAYGPGSLTLDGEQVAFDFRPEHAAQIVAHAEQKGEPIPLDCDHAAFLAAVSEGTEEAAAVATPHTGERLACGFADLRQRDDGLWAEIVSWSPRAAFLLKQKLYRYFSPVIRGLRGGNLRITSLALTNRPALDNLEPLVATQVGLAAQTKTPSTGGNRMDAIIAELAGLLDLDAAALSVDGLTTNDELPERLARLRTEVTELRRSRDEVRQFLDGLRAPLALNEDDGLPLAAGRVLALSERVATESQALAAAQETVAQMTQERLAADRKALIDMGLQAGQLTPFLVQSWAQDVDLAVLGNFLRTAPVLCPPGRQAPKPMTEAAPDAVLAMVARTCGMDPLTIRVAK